MTRVCYQVSTYEACKPSDTWEGIRSYFNTNSTIHLKFSFVKESGLCRYQEIDQSVSLSDTVSENAGFSLLVPIHIKTIQAKFTAGVGRSQVTNFDWREASYDFWHQETSDIFDTIVPAG